MIDLKTAANIAGSVTAFFLADKVPNTQVAQGIKAGALLYGGAAVVDALQQKIREQKADKEDGNNPAATQAQKLYDAIYAWGRLPLSSWTLGTNREMLLQMASEITCWEDVKKAYKRRFGDSLPDMIKNRLDADVRTAFYQQLERNNKHLVCDPTKTPAPGTGVQQPVSQLLVITKAATNARWAPRLANGPIPFEDTKIQLGETTFLKRYTFAPNTYLGRAVREHYDAKNNVYFTLVKNETNTGKTYFVWVANSRIDRLPTAAQITARKPIFVDKTDLQNLLAAQSKIER